MLLDGNSAYARCASAPDAKLVRADIVGLRLSKYEYIELVETRGRRFVGRDFFAGFVRLHVLHHAALGPIFGLEIIQELARHGYRLSPGTVYPLLHGMERDGLLRSSEVRSTGRPRRVYRATPRGKRILLEARARVGELLCVNCSRMAGHRDRNEDENDEDGSTGVEVCDGGAGARARWGRMPRCRAAGGEWLTGGTTSALRPSAGICAASTSPWSRSGIGTRSFISQVTRNWDAAAYQVMKIRLALEQAVERRPKRGPPMQPVLVGALSAVDQAIAARDAALFDERFDVLTASCNACHAAEKVAFFHVATPTVRTSVLRDGVTTP